MGGVGGEATSRGHRPAGTERGIRSHASSSMAMQRWGDAALALWNRNELTDLWQIPYRSRMPPPETPSAQETWSTAGLPPARQYAAWTARLARGRNPARAARGGGDDAPFPARMVRNHCAGLDMLSVGAPPHWFELRTRDEVEGANYFALFAAAPVILATSRASFPLARGGIVLADPRRDESLESADPVSYHTIRIPHALLDRHLPPSRRGRHVVPLCPSAPVRSLLWGYARTLAHDGAQLRSDEGTTVADSLCRLLAVASGEPDSTEAAGRGATRAARLARARQLIAQRLEDPDLAPAAIAAALGMSIRGLHLLFHGSGESFSRYLLRLRLEACRDVLVNPWHAGRSVTDIVFSLGFSELTTFYRAFRTHFGMTPGEMRARAGTASPGSGLR